VTKSVQGRSARYLNSKDAEHIMFVSNIPMMMIKGDDDQRNSHAICVIYIYQPPPVADRTLQLAPDYPGLAKPRLTRQPASRQSEERA
jgi:hypothetical protein